jgi:hypothetical protein
MKGILNKMSTELGNPIQYSLKWETPILMNDFIGKNLRMEFLGTITCRKCEKVTKKSFGEGFCYPCFTNAPEAAECIIRPELCRAHLGEGRDVEWEEANHNQPHVVYLAASDVVKVGVTRATQVPTRWIDQGAMSAIRIAETPNRYEAGRLEVELKAMFTDKTNWQRMLKNEFDESIDLEEEKWTLHEQLPEDLTEFFTEDDEIIEMNFPVMEFPSKVKSMSFDKEPIIEGKLMGIKGQYLIFDGGRVLNIRKHTSYHVEIS